MSDRELELEREILRLTQERDEALARAERYRIALDEAPVGVMCVALREGRYEFCNATHAAILGRELEQVRGGDPYKLWMETTHPDDFPRERLAFQRMIDGENDGYESERRIVQRDGSSKMARVRTRALRDAEGRILYSIVYLQDLSEKLRADLDRERLEAQLRQAQKLDALGRLAGGVAHDFNNRLVIIMGYSELLKRSLPEDSPLHQHADMILASSARASELTRQLLAFSRKQVLKPRTFDVNGCVDGMRRLLSRLIGEHIELVTSLEAAQLVSSDAGQIEQVLINLAINARDAMPRGGRLTLTTRDCELEEGNALSIKPGNYVAISVSDTGTGISEEVLPRIFEPFFTTKEVGQGTGLGLAMVEGIVEQSGGAVRVESRVGVGSRFTVYLPRAEGGVQAVRSSQLPMAEAPKTDETLLVCDDDDDVRRLVVEVLRMRGGTVLEARNGLEALELLAPHSKELKLLITDVVMPHMSGVELSRHFRQRCPGLPVLYLSGYTEDYGLLQGALAPGEHFLAKPFMPGDLTRAAANILDRGVSRSEPPVPLAPTGSSSPVLPD
ncbi:MAG TPA: ATP-binding protein, partial [Polyangiaceae bacterium]|nr:ATP-binding protein [Polyangiaceae bacterium]